MGTMHKVFVYGTLKKGEPNHHWFGKAGDCVYKMLGEGWTVEKYPLIIATKYNIPFLLYQPGVGHNVQGEVYDICDTTLKHLDELEDHPNFYVREQKGIRLKNDETVNAWVYFIENFKSELLEKTMYESYSNKGEHGLRYMERYLRKNDHNYKEDIFSKQQ